MSSNDHKGRDVREKIVSLMHSIEQGPKRRATEEESQKLRAAATRLDQMLKASAGADQQALKSAAARLDQLLSDIRNGKDVATALRRRNDQNKRT